MNLSALDRTIYEPESIYKPHWTHCRVAFTPARTLKLYGHKFTKTEIMKVRDYDEIYYLGQFVKQPDIEYTKFVGRSNIQVFLHDHLGFRYEITRIAHDGSYGLVVLTYDHKNKKYNHTKIVPNYVPLHSFYRYAARESTILKLLTENDPYNTFNCIPLLSYFMHENVYCMSFPTYGKSLKIVLKEREYRGFLPSQVKQYAIQILHALMYMHDSKIIHCNIKPGKIVYEYGNAEVIKIIGFEDSRFFEDFEYNGLQSLNYRAPEILLKMRASKAIDMWSFGCTLFELATGQRLYKGSNEYSQLRSIIDVNGLPPLSLITGTKYSETLFDGYDLLNSSGSKLNDTKGNCNKSNDDQLFLTSSPKDSLTETNIFDFVQKTEGFGKEFLDLVGECTNYLGHKRPEAIKALLSPWLDYRLEESKVFNYIVINHGNKINIQITPPKVTQGRRNVVMTSLSQTPLTSGIEISQVTNYSSLENSDQNNNPITDNKTTLKRAITYPICSTPKKKDGAYDRNE